MPIHYYQDENGFIVYENTNTGKSVLVFDGDLADAIEICQDWHGGSKSPCYKLMSNSDFSYANLRRTLNELRKAAKLAESNLDNKKINQDDYLDLMMTIEDLEGILGRIDRIAD